MRWFIPIVFLFIFGFGVEAASTEALNKEIEAVRKEREVLVAEQERLQAELDKTTREGQTLGTAVKSLDAARKKLLSDIKVTQSKITSADLSIKALENNVTTAERQINTHRSAIGSAIQTLFDYDRRPLVLELLASVSFSDIWQDRSELHELSLNLNEEVENLRAARLTLLHEKEKKEEKREEVVSLRKELDGQKVVVEEAKSAKERLLKETKSREAEYQKLIEENIARQKESEDDLYRLEQELRITLDPTLFPNPRRGVLSFPVASPYITGHFGKSDCRIYLGSDCFHNGLDLRASMGTAVKAMLSGVVLGTDNTDRQKGCYSYGLWILIKHDNGLSSLYAHLSNALVRTGQRVEVGQVIGYSGGVPGVYGSGYSKGPHLHLGLFASQGVEVRQFTTSRGCRDVSVPIASGRDAYLDPLLYLPAI